MKRIVHLNEGSVRRPIYQQRFAGSNETGVRGKSIDLDGNNVTN
jgi:hypothetical protein